MGQGGSKANVEQIVQIAKTKINFSPPLGAPNPVSPLCTTTLLGDAAASMRLFTVMPLDVMDRAYDVGATIAYVDSMCSLPRLATLVTVLQPCNTACIDQP